MTITKEIFTISREEYIFVTFTALIVLVVLLFCVVTALVKDDWIYFALGSIPVIITIVFCLWRYPSESRIGESSDHTHYEVIIDNENLSSDTKKKILENYEIKEKSTIDGLTKAIIEGPKYDTVFSQDEISVSQ